MRAVLFRSLAVAVALAATVAGPAVAGSLYEDLGGNPGLTVILGATLDATAADPRTADKFDNINLTWLKQRLVDQVCELTGGPCHFHGMSMAGTHRYLRLQDRHFNAMVEHLQDAMDAAGIPFRTQNRLLAVLAPLRYAIVTE